MSVLGLAAILCGDRNTVRIENHSLLWAHFSWKDFQMNSYTLCIQLYIFLICFLCFIILSTAPSAVSIMHQVSRAVDSITLSWSQPDQPNGVILDYELQYYEKVISTEHDSLLSKNKTFNELKLRWTLKQ